MKALIRVLSIFLLITGFLAPHADAQQRRRPTRTDQSTSYTYRLLPLPDGTWGYDIMVNGKLTIHQPSVPGLQGNKGLKSKAAASKVAGLVIAKMKRGEMPPTVTWDELRKLKAMP